MVAAGLVARSRTRGNCRRDARLNGSGFGGVLAGAPRRTVLDGARRNLKAAHEAAGEIVDGRSRRGGFDCGRRLCRRSGLGLGGCKLGFRLDDLDRQIFLRLNGRFGDFGRFCRLFCLFLDFSGLLGNGCAGLFSRGRLRDFETLLFTPALECLAIRNHGAGHVAEHRLREAEGPYLACGIAGKYKIAGVKSDFFGDDAAKRFDFGLGMGVAYEINKFFIDLTGEFGLTKIADGDDAPKNMNFSIGVGYKF